MINFAIYIIFIVILLNKKCNKRLFISAIIYLCLFSVFCYEKSDLDGYRFLFIFPEKASDVLFAKSLLFFKQFSSNFNVFMGITLALCIIILGYVINRNSENYNMVLALYMLSPFLVDNIQIRNFIAYMIITFATLEFLWKQKKDIFYLIFAVIAFNFHTLACFYFIYFIVNKIKNFKKVYFLMSIFVFFVPCIVKLAKLILQSVSWKMNIYARNLGINFDWRILLICLSIIAQIYIFGCIVKRSKSFAFTSKERQLFALIYKINIVNILTIALIVYVNVNFFRISRNLLVANYITFVKYYQKKKDKRLLALLIFSGLIQGLLFQVSAFKSLFINNSFFRIFTIGDTT